MQYDISIVGCGPVGATLANLLGHFGYTVAIFEKEMKVYRAPRAVHIDDEVVRIFQAVGILDKLKANIVPFERMQFVSAKGKVMLEACSPSNYQPYGHTPANWFLQPVLEELLRAQFEENSNIRFYQGCEVNDLIEQSASVQLTALELRTQKEITIESKYLIGCDGGKSLVRKSMAVTFDSLNFDQSWMVVDTFVKSAQDLELLPHLHQQICDPYRPVTYVPGVGNHRRFEFMLRADETPESIAEPEMIHRLLASFIDPQKLEIARSAVYTFHGLIANQWKKGRLILAGDSAHQMPPFAGQGMCSGIRDAHNLAFKLDLVLSGLASQALLDSYQAERKPHVTEISKGAIKMGKLIQAQTPYKVWLRDLQFFLAQRSSYLQTKMQEDFVKKTPYKQGFIGKRHPLSGQLAIQPTISVGQNRELWLDELLGNQFALISTQKLGGTHTQAFEKQLGAKILILNKDFQATPFEEWMAKHDIDFVLIRPDRYIYDAGKMKHLEQVFTSLSKQLD
ncbi:MAG: bifunctional 3-(3-hydroxy-phenyl)propionate/3-hydroxycinnamic acid hydroxylase [Saprospiraceae bacterium]|nr:bifunctional 3-(3-hydroxy-phenyl)propionate/3-hydroxycinnamic acid hydroxylase [Saprospiraceae bacterium]